MAAPKAINGMTTRQKITIGLFAVVLIVLAYMVYGMFRGPATTTTTTTTTSTASRASTTNNTLSNPATLSPRPSTIAKAVQQRPLSQREVQLIQLQQASEAKYVDALNELQLLKIEREIAENNKAIASAKLDTVTAQTKIVSLLKPPAPTPAVYAQGLVGPTSTAPVSPPTTVIKPPPSTSEDVTYTVISVSLIHSRWSAVVGYQGTLYQIHVGDVLPADGSKVISIDKSGIILEKDAARRRVSLVPII